MCICQFVRDASPPKLFNGFGLNCVPGPRSVAASVSHSDGDRPAGVTPGESKMWFSEVDSNRQSFSRLFLCPCSLLTVGLRRKNQFVYDDDDDDDDDGDIDLCCQ